MAKPPSRVAVVGGARTPFAKAGTHFSKHSALDLATHSIDGLIARFAVDPELVDEMEYGIVTLDARMPQFAREVNFRSGLPPGVRSYTVVDNCITGITAISNITDSIRMGRAGIGIAGGVDSMSNPAILFSRNAARVFSGSGICAHPGREGSPAGQAPACRLQAADAGSDRALHRALDGRAHRDHRQGVGHLTCRAG